MPQASTLGRFERPSKLRKRRKLPRNPKNPKRRREKRRRGRTPKMFDPEMAGRCRKHVLFRNTNTSV